MGDLQCDPGSDESLALMKGWIDDCQRSHQPCKMPHQLGGPKRLLQCLSKSDGFVRLVETQSRTQPYDYIALSYCWGDGTAVKKTTMETLGNHQRGIPDESLPPLYREVVALARGLNIPFLWIDSLCITQDSDKDKEEEIKQMSDIFRGALVVVVAASAESPLNSLLEVKPQSDQRHTWHTASLIRYQEMDLDVKFRKRHEETHNWPDATRFTPIAKRAWCFQEKLLASRCLVFRGDEVVWECRSCCLCECGGEQEHFDSVEHYSMVRAMKRYRQMLLPFAEHEPFQLDGTLKYFADAETAYSFWETAVKNYSARELTFQTDRLPAISAVASVVAKGTGDRYLAGLWRDDLLDGLGWIADPANDSRSHQEYIAPSWSWASRPRGGTYCPRSYGARDSHDADLDVSVLDAWTALEGQNPYGPVSDAAIVLSGFHCDAELMTGEGEFAQLDFGHGDVQTVGSDSIKNLFCHALDFMRVEPDTNANVDRPGGNVRYLRHVTDRDKRFNYQSPCSGTVRLLWLAEEISLILTPSRLKEGAYEKLGIFHPGLLFELLQITFKVPKMPKMVQRSNITLV